MQSELGLMELDGALKKQGVTHLIRIFLLPAKKYGLERIHGFRKVSN